MRPQPGLSGLVLCGQVTWMFLGLPPHPHTHTHGCRAWLCPYYVLVGLGGLSVSKPYSPAAGEAGSVRYIWWPRGHGPEHVSDNLKRLPGEPRMGPAEKWTSWLGGGAVGGQVTGKPFSG